MILKRKSDNEVILTQTSDFNIFRMTDQYRYFRDRRLRAAAEGKLLPTRKFEKITFGEILEFRSKRHGKSKPGR